MSSLRRYVKKAKGGEMRKQVLFSSVAITAASVLLAVGCGNNATNRTENMGVAVAVASPTVANATPIPVVSPADSVASDIETNEPIEYSANLRLTAVTKGKNTSLPPITANVAREGEKRRVSFRLPNNEQVVYLNLGGTRYLIMPNRKQYAEIGPNDIGFQIPQLMMPDQIVDYLKRRDGFERVGDDQVNGRKVVKYRAAGSTRTNSAAGAVESESFTYVDKETGLPLRAELDSQAEGNVQGIEGFRTVIEMTDVKTDTAPGLFDVPEGYNKITGDEIRSQFNAFAQTVAAVAGAILNNMNAPKSAASPK
jgi:hypothetical protein